LELGPGGDGHLHAGAPDLTITSVTPIPSGAIAGTPLFGASSILHSGSYVYSTASVQTD
jgi:hypothetical protein